MNTQDGNNLKGIHVVAKPAGPACNLNCEYCFYLEKQALFGKDEKYRMSDDVLGAFIMNYITSQPTPVGVAAPSTVSQEPAMTSRGSIISAKDTRSFFCTSRSI